MITLEQIRKRLQNAINESELTKAEICRQIGIKQPTLSQYLNGRAMPALDTFANLCFVLDVPSEYILGLEDEKGSKIQNTIRDNHGNITINQK